jgi:hypothetical protein
LVSSLEGTSWTSGNMTIRILQVIIRCKGKLDSSLVALLNTLDIATDGTTDDKKMGLNHNMVDKALYKKAGLYLCALYDSRLVQQRTNSRCGN